MVNVLLSIQNDLLRAGITSILKEHKGSISIQVTSFKEVVERLQRADFDVVILETDLSGLNSSTIIRRLRNLKPDLKILLLSEESEKIWMIPCFRMGVDGVCLKSMSGKEFCEAFDHVLNGNKHVSEGLAKFLLQELFENKRKDSLSARESEVMDLLLKGYGNLQICDKLRLKPSTISTMKGSVFRKMQVTSIVELMRKMPVQTY